MSNMVKTESFVVPSVRNELGGELGLDLHQIAASLEAQYQHLKRAFLKLKDEGEFVSAVPTRTQQEIQEVTGHKYIKEVESYVLTVDDAKFLVTQYGNKMGREYCKFLIARDKTLAKVQGQITNPLDAFRAILHSLEAQQTQLDTVQQGQLKLVAQYGEANLTSAQVGQLTAAVAKKVRESGAEPKANGIIMGALKKQFIKGNVSKRTYKEIPSKYFDKAMDFVANFELY